MRSRRYKKLLFPGDNARMFYWRTYTGAELDYVEQCGTDLHGYEFKWGKRSARPPASWVENYAAPFTSVSRDNWLSFVT